MNPFLILAVVAVPVVYLVTRKRATPRRDKAQPTDIPHSGVPTAEELFKPAPQVDISIYFTPTIEQETFDNRAEESHGDEQQELTGTEFTFDDPVVIPGKAGIGQGALEQVPPPDAVVSPTGHVTEPNDILDTLVLEDRKSDLSSETTGSGTPVAYLVGPDQRFIRLDLLEGPYLFADREPAEQQPKGSTIAIDIGNDSSSQELEGMTNAEGEISVNEIESALSGLERLDSPAIVDISDDQHTGTDDPDEFLEDNAELEKAAVENGSKQPARYRPPTQRQPRQSIARGLAQKIKRMSAPGISQEIRVRATFDRFNYCAIGLLPGRTLDLDDEITVEHGSAQLQLVAQEEWYQDLQLDDIGQYLSRGLELTARLKDTTEVRWSLSGRDIFVLASHPRASGFVSTHQLLLGRSHVVMCTTKSFEEVKATLNDAGCQGYTTLDCSHGVPSGWVAIRGVLPRRRYF